MTADKINQESNSSFELVPSDHPQIVQAIPTTDTTSGTRNEDEIDNLTNTDILVGCGVAGLIVGGPCLALITALGGNWAKEKEGPFGESTRALGRIAQAAGSKAKDERLLHKMKASVVSIFDEKEEVQET